MKRREGILEASHNLPLLLLLLLELLFFDFHGGIYHVKNLISGESELKRKCSAQ